VFWGLCFAFDLNLGVRGALQEFLHGHGNTRGRAGAYEVDDYLIVVGSDQHLPLVAERAVPWLDEHLQAPLVQFLPFAGVLLLKFLLFLGQPSQGPHLGQPFLSFPLLLFPSVSGQQPLPFQLFLGLWRELNMDTFLLKHPLEEHSLLVVALLANRPGYVHESTVFALHGHLGQGPWAPCLFACRA
jgi:hypothetical protein